MGQLSYLAAAGAGWRGNGVLNGSWGTVSLCLQLSICKGLHKQPCELTLTQMCMHSPMCAFARMRTHTCMHSHAHIIHRTSSPLCVFTCMCSHSPLVLVSSSMGLCPSLCPAHMRSHIWHVFNYVNMCAHRRVHAFTYVSVQLCALTCMCTHPPVRASVHLCALTCMCLYPLRSHMLALHVLPATR